MKHPQAFVVLLIAVSVAFGVLIWVGSLWGALGALIGGFVLRTSSTGSMMPRWKK